MYPKWKYNVTEPGVIVYCEQDEIDLGPEWVDEHVGGFAVADPETVETETIVIKKGPGRPKKTVIPEVSVPDLEEEPKDN